MILVQTGSTTWEGQAACFSGVKSEVNPEEMRLQGTMPLPLSEEDLAALSEIAETLRDEEANVLYSSGNESSGPSAKYLAEKCHLKARKEPLLQELDCGLWQGLQIKDIKHRYGRAYKKWRNDPLSVCPPQGECVSDARERVFQALDKLIRKNKNKVVVIVAAPIVASLVECLITEDDMGHFWEYAEQGRKVRIFPSPHLNSETINTL